MYTGDGSVTATAGARCPAIGGVKTYKNMLIIVVYSANITAKIVRLNLKRWR